MHKLNYLLSVLMVIFMSAMVLLLSSSLVLHMSSTYVYHFNDSEIMYEIPYNVSGNDMAKEITSYFISFKDEPFQVYEDNRIFKDPIMEKEDQNVMLKLKKVLNIELISGLISALLFLCTYGYLFHNDFKKALRNRYKVGLILSVLLIIVHSILCCIKSFRLFAYKHLIGIKLSKYSIIGTILGDPFFKTYVMFAIISGIVILALMTYIHHRITKPDRIFY